MPIFVGFILLIVLLYFFWFPLLIAGMATLIVYELKKRKPDQFGMNLWFVAAVSFLLTLLVQHTLNGTARTVHHDSARVVHPEVKADSNVRRAELRYGGFNGADRILYENGLRHIANQHQRPGNFTIGQVIGDEKTRETQRALALELAHASFISAIPAPAPSIATRDEAQRTCDSINNVAPGSVRECKQLDDHSMLIVVDADDYNAFGAQDQKLIRAGYFMHWTKVWEADHPDKQGESDLYLGIKDLVGNDLGFFTFSSAQPGVN